MQSSSVLCQDTLKHVTASCICAVNPLLFMASLGLVVIPVCVVCSGNRILTYMLTMQGVGPAIGGVRLSDRPILGPDAGPAPVATAARAEAPGMFERVKQLVGLGPASTTSAVCSLLYLVDFKLSWLVYF